MAHQRTIIFCANCAPTCQVAMESTNGVDIAFIPAGEDVPSYVLPMLNDIDRNKAYENAISATIARFQAEHGRAPTVLDVGAGTGMLTTIALKHGAAHVTAIEANKTLRSIAERQVAANAAMLGRTTDDWSVLGALSLDFKGGPFDVLVSELLGSMINSESQYLYMWDLMMRGVIRNFGSKQTPAFYTVPQAGCMTMRAYHCPRATGLVTGIPYAPMDVLHAAVYNSEFSATLDWTQDESLRICLAGDCEPLSDAVEVLSEQYNMVSGAVAHPQTVELTIPVDEQDLQHVILVLEWVVTLADGIYLRHDLEHVASLPVPVMLARWVAWGHLFSPLSRCIPALSATSKYTFSVAYRPAGLKIEAQVTLPPPAAAPVTVESEINLSDDHQPTNSPEVKKRRVRVFPGLKLQAAGPKLIDHKTLAMFVMTTKHMHAKGFSSV